MKQHYTQSNASKNLDIWKIAEMSEKEARQTLQQIRWAHNSGQPVCPHCGCVDINAYRSRPIFKCTGCLRQFSITSGTIFAGMKISAKRLLRLVGEFATGSCGHVSNDLSRMARCHANTAFVIAHKIREAMVSDTAAVTLTGEVEIDGCYTGKYWRKANNIEDRRHRNYAPSRNKKVVIVARERNGVAITTVVKQETLGVPFVIERVDHNAIVHADEAAGWDVLDQTFWLERVRHKLHYSNERSNTNQAESFYSRFRRLERTHVHVSGEYLDLYAGETAWRENNRRVSDAERYLKVLMLTLRHPVSRRFAGYFQRRTGTGRRRRPRTRSPT